MCIRDSTALVLPLFKKQTHIRVELRRALSIKGNRALPLVAAGRLLHIDLEVDAPVSYTPLDVYKRQGVSAINEPLLAFAW